MSLPDIRPNENVNSRFNGFIIFISLMALHIEYVPNSPFLKKSSFIFQGVVVLTAPQALSTQEKGATRRTLTRGTAKRLSKQHAKPRRAAGCLDCFGEN
jgi:hypothetical protein